MVSTTKYPQEDAIELTEDELIIPLRDNSVIRNKGIYPVKTIAEPEDLIAYYWKVVDDFNLGYTLEPYDSPLSHQGLTKTSVNLPVIHGKLHFGYDELKRINRSMLTTDQRTVASVANMGLKEEYISLAGSSGPDYVVTSVSTTGTNSTAAVAELNVTTIDLIASTLSGMIGQLIDGNIMPDRYPLKLVVTPDVYKVAMGVLDVNDKITGVEFIENMLNKHGGAGSGLIMSKYLGGTSTKNAKKDPAVTAGTTNACLYAVSTQFYEIIASPIDIRSDGISKVNGLDYQFLERFIPVYKEKKGIIYSGTVVTA